MIDGGCATTVESAQRCTKMKRRQCLGDQSDPLKRQKTRKRVQLCHPNYVSHLRSLNWSKNDPRLPFPRFLAPDSFKIIWAWLLAYIPLLFPPLLIRFLLRKDPCPSVASAACRALGQLKNSSSSTAAAVAELLQDPSPMVKAQGMFATIHWTFVWPLDPLGMPRALNCNNSWDFFFYGPWTPLSDATRFPSRNTGFISGDY